MPTRPIDVFVIGGANFDYEITGSALPQPGETVAGTTFYEGPGGRGANQAVAAARLGAHTAVLCSVGADERGQRILAQLRDDKVDTTGVVMHPTLATGVALILVDARGDKLIMTAPGANLRLEVSDVARAAPTFASSKVVLVQLEAGVPVALAAARQARHAHALVVLDAAPPVPLPDELLTLIDVVRCNASEAGVLTGIAVTDEFSAHAAGLALRDRGAGAACIATTGGALLVFETDEVWLPHQHVHVVDVTGAGDAFAAGIAVGLAEDRSLADAAWLGCAAAALKATRLGAQAGLPHRDAVDGLLSTIHRDD